jgi:hypothetical protein
MGTDEVAAGSQSSNEVCNIDGKAEQVSLSELACKFICQAKRRVTTPEIVNRVVEGCPEIIKTVIGDLRDNFLSLWLSPTDEAAWDGIDFTVNFWFILILLKV